MKHPFSNPAPHDYESRSDRALAVLEARERAQRFDEYVGQPLRTPAAMVAFVAAPLLSGSVAGRNARHGDFSETKSMLSPGESVYDREEFHS